MISSWLTSAYSRQPVRPRTAHLSALLSWWLELYAPWGTTAGMAKRTWSERGRTLFLPGNSGSCPRSTRPVGKEDDPNHSGEVTRPKPARYQGSTFTTHFQTMTATTTDSGEQCCQVWLPNIKVRPTDRLKRLTLLNRQQPMEPLGSWQQVEPSGHQDFESGHMTPAWTRPTTPHQHPHTHRLERKQGTIIL